MQKQIFKTTIVILVTTLFTLSITTVNADPVGDLPPPSDFTKQMMDSQGKSLQDMKEAIPSKETVGVPIFPGSLYCSEMSGEGMLPSIIMASDKSVEAISDWYMQQEGLNWSEMWGMFYVGDEYVMMKSEAVLIQDISADPQACACGMAFDMTGMKTQLSITYKPKTGLD